MLSMKTKSILQSVLLVLFIFSSFSTVFAKEENKTVVYEGWLSAYDKEPTDHTIEYRLENGDIQEGYDTYIAVPECNRIGETGKIVFANGTEKSYQVFDCASRNVSEDNSHGWMKENNIIAEIDYYSWQEQGLGRAKLITEG